MDARLLAATLLLTSVASACGTRVAPPEAPLAAPRAAVSGPRAGDLPEGTRTTGRPATLSPGASDVGGAARTGGVSAADSAPGRRDQAAAVGTFAPGARHPAPGSSQPPGPEPPSARPRSPEGTSPTAPGASPSPVKIASVGTLSGPVGSVLGGVVRGLQVWVRHVNDEGGLNGHLVELHVADDGGDPARHRAIVQEMIERQGVIAFVANPEAQSGAGSVDYVTSKGVPVIGGDTAFEWMYQSPMYFPQATSGHSLLYGVLAVTADEARAQGRRRFGSITCVEGQICADADRIWAAYAARVGLEPVFRARASLAQPDFTAECLQARQHGVEVWQLVLDQNSVQRLAAACARQGFHPLYAVANSIVDNRLRTDPNLAGALGDLNVFPFFQTDTPATAEFSAAMGRYADRLEFGAGEATGWVAGKLFERALRAVPDPPTSQAVLRGLWSLENETLGGITQPLTFHERQRAPRDPACLFKVGIKDGTWASLDGFHLHCSALPPDFG